MIYPIVLYGDPVLKKKAADIEEDFDVKTLAEDMFQTMEAASGVGLAAPQIGKSLRMFVIDTSPMKDEGEEGMRKVFINPEIVEESGKEWAFEEGCLSIPGIREDVMRQPKIVINYLDTDWNEHEEEFDEIEARVIQHEYDHIEGVLFTDHVSNFKKRLIKGKLTNISKGKVKADYRVKAASKK